MLTFCDVAQQVNDAARNDTDEKASEDVLDKLKELGAYGMQAIYKHTKTVLITSLHCCLYWQVPSEYGGIGLTNTQVE